MQQIKPKKRRKKDAKNRQKTSPKKNSRFLGNYNKRKNVV